jgi:hypothetical protein
MAIGIYFSPAAMSAAKYDECIKLLKKAGRATRLDVRTMRRLGRKTN